LFRISFATWLNIRTYLFCCAIVLAQVSWYMYTQLYAVVVWRSEKEAPVCWIFVIIRWVTDIKPVRTFKEWLLNTFSGRLKRSSLCLLLFFSVAVVIVNICICFSGSIAFRLAYSLMFYTLYSVYTHNEDWGGVTVHLIYDRFVFFC